ncbi:probable O-methyltransferase 2 [Hordeum vulgare subsp. vulgare]|uniref:O-methyltransferase ZRP4 n=1 Tax=Hordeum vulgare subsp. vulgare TaxID=112509 RepID=A0A8I6XX64_HORVV|nr:probable O-methyltransferase 2 [Hordeum vulgare subsp. vulgare]
MAGGEAATMEVPTDAELLQAQADLWRHSLYYLTSMGLRCAIKLGIPTAIHRLGGVTSLPDLMAALSLPASKQPFLGRLMRVLVTSGVFAAGGNGSESGSEAGELFSLNPLSRILVDGVVGHDEHHSQTSFVLAATSPFYTEAALGLADWFRKDVTGPAVPSPFEDVHGASLFDESTALLDKELDELVTEGLAAHDNLGIGTIMRECHDLFKGLESLTDCCGGDGTTARAITKAHPHVKCTVLDLPKVIDKAPSDGIVNCVAGDLFHSVPKSQAVMLKLVLHHWSDEDCVKILSQCRDAIPSHEEGGKVIIIDIVVGPSLGPVMFEAQLLMDMLMLVNTRGRQRTENDWHELFMKAGFSDYKIVKKLGARGVFEVYK